MKIYRLLIGSIVLILLGLVLAKSSAVFMNEHKYIKNFESVLKQKCDRMHRHFKRLDGSDETKTLEIIEEMDDERIIIFKYLNDSLILWSSNMLPVNTTYSDSLYGKKIVRFFNSFYYVEKLQHDSVKYIGLILIKSRYPYENDFLHSGFDKDFKVPEGAKLQFTKGKGYEVHSPDGEYLFNLLLPEVNNQKDLRSVIATMSYFAGLIILGLFLFILLRNISNYQKRWKYCSILITGIAAIRILQLLIPLNISEFVLFDPFIYADSFLVPSLGDLLLNSIIVLFFAIIINRLIYCPEIFSSQSSGRGFVLILLNLVLLLFFIYAQYFFRSLIFNSKISFGLSDINQISIYTFISLIINGINFFSVALILIWQLRVLMKSESLFEVFRYFLIVAGIVFACLYIVGYPVDLISLVGLTLFYILFGIIVRYNLSFFKYSLLEIFIFLFSIYSLICISHTGSLKGRTIKSSLAMSLANEHDPIAEYLFEDISRQILNDTSIMERLNRSTININRLYNYLKKNYFTGYWNKYDIQITLCGPGDSVLIEVPDYQWYYCYGFFEDILKEVGQNLTDTNIYYLENYTGRISYIGRFPFAIQDPPYEITLFVEFDTRFANEFIGYPELLLDKRFHQQRVVDQYSYAKYHRGKMISRHGNFNYSMQSEIYGEIKDVFMSKKMDGFIHLIYKPDKDNLIILSRPADKFIDYLITFSYLFLLYYLCLVMAVLIKNFRGPGTSLLSNFRSKMQFSIITILIISLVLISITTIWLNINSYTKNQDEILNEKLQSVLIELKHKLYYENQLTPDWRGDRYDNLDQLLIKFSDVFYTDINLYDSSGDLLATSRKQIFQTGLQGEKMDPVAYYKLNNEKRTQYIHHERINRMSYLSAYIPFENSEGNLLAYVNLPYFIKQGELKAALSTLMVTIINIYVILILITIFITLIISNQITKPLAMIQMRLRELKPGKKYEYIEYKRNDEIGDLVIEYNRMVTELEKSIDKLAQSERESAWREMAKQIAHEIKNPLTPMKLSVQQLLRSWKDKGQDFEKYLETVTETLMEQIDNLSAIASAFSNFAKMPDAKREEVELITAIKNTIHLFDGSENCKIVFNPKMKEVPIFADRDQLTSVFLNIIKNGMQSIPENKKGLIKVNLTTDPDWIIVKIQDNGKGIPKDIQAKMFIPNFTTKSSGMGLGLAIVRNILYQMEGDITFETEVGKGTTFILRFPAMKS